LAVCCVNRGRWSGRDHMAQIEASGADRGW
jgi:hypothetical protein